MPRRRVLVGQVLPALCVVLLLTAHLLTAPPSAGAQPELPTQLPDLTLLRTEGLRIGNPDTGAGRALRFHTVTANRGDWSLEIHGEDVDVDAGTSTAAQCIRWDDARTCAETTPIGTLTLHPDHGHTHLEDYALLELRRIDEQGRVDESPEGLVAPTNKASFCLVDTVRDGPIADPAFASRRYNSCGPRLDLVYGISAGWRDVYDSTLEGQQIRIDAVGDGDYALRVTVDPEGMILESDETNNVVTTTLRLSDGGTTVTHLRRFAGVNDSGAASAVAAELCRHAHPGYRSVERVVLGRSDVFADTLGGAPLAGPDGCVLYTSGGPDAPLDAVTLTELRRALPPEATVHVLGGAAAISAAAEATLVAEGYDVDRIAGTDRYDTAAQVAERVRARNPASTTTLLANAGTFADAVTGGAYAAHAGVPIVLTDAGSLHPRAAQALADLGTSRTVVLGGEAAVSTAAAGATPGPERVAGSNRMATAVAIAQQLWGDDGTAAEELLLANLEQPDAWAAALAASPLSALLGSPLLGVTADRLPDETRAHLAAGATALTGVDALGSTGAVSHAVHIAATDIALED